MTNSDYWLMLFLLFSMNPDGFKEAIEKDREKAKQKDELQWSCLNPEGFKKAIEKDREKVKQKDELQRSCPNIEWEQDMGAHIPFCRLTNDFCDLHCKE